jgi:hypothetical protein
MRRFVQLICLAVLFSAFLPTPSGAQSPVAGTIAAGGDIGVLFPDEVLEKTFTIDGFGEYYVAPRISIRGLLAWASPGFENFTEDKFRQYKLLFNGIYYWDYEKLKPFATVGAGAYFVRELLDDAVDPDSETRGGMNFGGGTEFSLGTQAAARVEVRFDLVSHPAGTTDATGLSLTFGFKRYF